VRFSEECSADAGPNKLYGLKGRALLNGPRSMQNVTLKIPCAGYDFQTCNHAVFNAIVVTGYGLAHPHQRVPGKARFNLFQNTEKQCKQLCLRGHTEF
jgi:hypothetical protein